MFTAGCGGRTRENRHKLKAERFRLEIKKNFLRSVKQRKRLNREVVQSPSLEAFMTHLDEILNLVWSQS